MKKTSRSFLKAASVIFAALLISQNQSAFAGWTGLINGVGVGWASVNVRSSTQKTNRVTTVNNLASPSAAMAPATGYKTNAPLPQGASTTTYSRIKGLSGGIWQATSKAAVGDGTDNLELQNRVNIIPADCANLTFDSFINQSQAQFNANGNSGSITVNAKATGGTALWLRGFEFTGSMADVPIDDPATVQNESIEYLKTNGVVKFETLVLGPFEFGGTNTNINNCPLTIPFTLTSSNLEHLVFASDAAVLSLPLVIVCPPSIVVGCNESFSYPPVQFAGCGDITVTYSPARLDGPFPAGSFPVGVTPVTATATDSDGNSTSCTFTVTVTDSIPPVAPVLPTLIGSCATPVNVIAPTAIDNCAGTITGTTTNSLDFTPGTNTIYWLFNDGHGNTSVATQKVVLTGLTFTGFYSPIGGTGGSCGSPRRMINKGSNLPVKFDVACAKTPYRAGRPTLSIEKSDAECTSLTVVTGGDFALVGNEWHFNWDTSSVAKGTYKLTATLQDGSRQSVWIKLK